MSLGSTGVSGTGEAASSPSLGERGVFAFLLFFSFMYGWKMRR